MNDSIVIQPSILYFGTPVVLVSSLNPDGSTNLAPMSSAWALGWDVFLGLGTSGQTFANLEQHRECVLNLPDASLWRQVEALAPLTGRNPVPGYKQERFRHEPDKFGAAGLTPIPSQRVAPVSVAECPIKLEGVVKAIHPFGDAEPGFPLGVGAVAVEVRILEVRAHPAICRGDHVLPGNWNPLIYNFRHYFGLGVERGFSFRSETPGNAETTLEEGTIR